MKILYSPIFQKHLKRLPVSQRKLALEQIYFFSKAPSDPLFQDHKLRGRFSIYRAFSVDEDLRVIYRLLSSDCIKLVDIGPHSKVYKA